jgi:hypothetical protein
MKFIDKPEMIMILWFLAFATILIILTLKFQNYDISIRATTSALLTTPFAIVALFNIILNSQLQTEKLLSSKWDKQI